jgi:hypothetical protein
MKIRNKLEELLKRENNKVEHNEWVHETMEINDLVQEREFGFRTLEKISWNIKDSGWHLILWIHKRIAVNKVNICVMFMNFIIDWVDLF